MSRGSAIAMVCAGCGWTPPAGEPLPLNCARAGDGDDTDHVLARRCDPSRLRFPAGEGANPFLRYRELLVSWHAVRATGREDGEFTAAVERLDAGIAAVDGRGFALTPFARQRELSVSLGFGAEGGVWVKDETGNVSGSHKARHLMGIALALDAREYAAGGGPSHAARQRLAIASCGNAALAAAVVAHAARRPLEVFVPTDAEPAVVERLRALDARLTVCPREAGAVGDPCVTAFRLAVARGALPFACQGSENGLAIEGGETLGFEMVEALGRERPLDRLFVQVGGGALASACIQAFREAIGLGARAHLPRLHAVQTRGAHPLARAYDLLATRIAERLALPLDLAAPERAEAIRVRAEGVEVREALRFAATHRSQFMWPWEETPRSIAHGILDDETYDWHAVVSGMLESGGFPVVVDEPALEAANALARASTGIAVSPTGSAGLAGLLALSRQGAVGPGETVAVIFSGIQR